MSVDVGFSYVVYITKHQYLLDDAITSQPVRTNNEGFCTIDNQSLGNGYVGRIPQLSSSSRQLNRLIKIEA